MAAGTREKALTVRELLEDSGLGLTTATGSAGLGRVVRDIHFSDAEDPVPYLSGESVLVVTGRNFAGDDEAAVRLLDRLATIDTAALVIAMGHYVDAVPPAMIEHATRSGSPSWRSARLLRCGRCSRTCTTHSPPATCTACAGPSPCRTTCSTC